MSSYGAAVDHLLGLTQELAGSPQRKFDLEHMRVLMRALGDPQDSFPSVLIAGTNGKGSTAATLASILTAAGHRTGLYTSPHLVRVTERVRTSNFNAGPSPLTEIPEADFARLYFRVDEAARALVRDGKLPHHPSFFETLTALAFLYFADRTQDGGSGQPVDIAVLEVGMGGRLDATNIGSPVLSVITDIALDHQEYLGSTIAEIAREKAGILRANGNLVVLPQHPEANQVIGEVAMELNVRAVSAAPYLPGRDVAAPLDLHGAPLPHNRYTLHVDGQRLHVDSPLAGEHQRRNLALAIGAALELGNSFRHVRRANAARFQVSMDAIERGIAATHWPGRLEFVPPNLLLDVAHNPAGAWALRAAIAALPESRPRTLIFSCLRDKDLTEISRILFPLFDAPHRLILTPVASPRAAALEALVEAANALSIPAETAASPAEALALARRVTPAEGMIVATGSIYLVGAVLTGD